MEHGNMMEYGNGAGGKSIEGGLAWTKRKLPGIK